MWCGGGEGRGRDHTRKGNDDDEDDGMQANAKEGEWYLREVSQSESGSLYLTFERVVSRDEYEYDFATVRVRVCDRTLPPSHCQSDYEVNAGADGGGCRVEQVIAAMGG